MYAIYIYICISIIFEHNIIVFVRMLQARIAIGQNSRNLWYYIVFACVMCNKFVHQRLQNPIRQCNVILFARSFFSNYSRCLFVRTAMQGAGGPARSQYPLRPNISQVLADEIFHPKAQRGKTCIANGFLEGMVPIRF